MIVVGCMIVWECESTIGDTLKSIENFVDRIIVVDGTYKPFATHFRSRDETLTKIRGFSKPRTIVGNSTGKPYRSEVFTRNLYMLPQYFMNLGEDEPKDPRWLFVIDADEYVVSGIDETLKLLETSSEPYYRVTRMWKTPWEQIIGDQHRVQLFKYVKGMKYVDNHYTIQYPNGTQVRTDSPAPLSPLKIVHQPERKTPRYQEDMLRYNREVRPKVEKPNV